MPRSPWILYEPTELYLSSYGRVEANSGFWREEKIEILHFETGFSDVGWESIDHTGMERLAGRTSAPLAHL
ncbi:hypothetical protein [Streptosporangium vulgare]|uniref:Uncharacterized protein n=1 Tax=Streptosporangium vulgare TaxID=46190 RepID=A0ABV5TM27_9ACTN